MTDWQKAREAALAAMADSQNCTEGSDYRTDVFFAVQGHHRLALDAALSAFEKAGFVLVPKQATPEMQAAGAKQVPLDPEYGTELGQRETADDVFDSMIAAAIAERQK